MLMIGNILYTLSCVHLMFKKCNHTTNVTYLVLSVKKNVNLLD